MAPSRGQDAAGSKWLSISLIFAQIVFAAIALRYTPDYYARTTSRVLAWAYSSGIWILAVNAAMTLVAGIIETRRRTLKSEIIFVISLLITGVWMTYPYAYSLLGDLVHWRFP